MKKILTSRIFVAIITAIVCISVTAYATTQIQASNVIYNNTTVDQVLDNLYTTQTTRITELENSLSNIGSIIDFSPTVGWTTHGGTGWTAGTTATNSITLQTNKTYMLEILGGLNKANTTFPTINTTFTNATCSLIDSKIDYNSISANNSYHFWFVKLYKCVPTSTTVTITQSTTTNDYIWFYTKAYEL